MRESVWLLFRARVELQGRRGHRIGAADDLPGRQPVGTQAAGPDARRQARSAPQRPDLAVPPGRRAVLSEALRAKPTHDWEEGNMNAATFAGEYDVAIIGLGPTGLTLAHLLGRRGLRVLALEREPEFYGNARAVYTDDECMRVFQAAGVAAELEADMLTACCSPIWRSWTDGTSRPINSSSPRSK